MTKMPASFRLRLTLWNVGVLAVALALFAAVLFTLTRLYVQRNVDQELARRADRFRRDPREFGPVGPGGPPGERGQNPGRGFGTPRQSRPDQAQAQNQFQNRQGPGGPGRPRLPDLDPDAFDPEFLRRYEIRRPMVLDLEGHVVAPFPNANPWDTEAARQAASGQTVFTFVKIEDLTLRVLSAPYTDHAGEPRILQMATDIAVLQQVSRAQTVLLLIIIPSALALAAAGGLLVSQKALRPLENVTKTAEEIDESHLDRRLPVTGDDELARLATKFNEMVARLDEAFQRQKSLLEAQKQFTADASHELRTPLTRIKLATGSALDPNSDQDEKDHSLQVIDTAADAMARLVEQLLVLARAEAAPSAPAKPIDLLPHLRQAITISNLDQDSRLQFTAPADPILANIDPDAFVRIAVNLLTNAARHTPDGKSIHLSLESDPSKTNAILTVRDEGEGIPAEHLPHLTERFYRIDPHRNRADGGSGLGLAITKALVENNSGTLTLSSQPGKGTTATVALPLN